MGRDCGLSDGGDYCTACWAEITFDRGGSVSDNVERARHFGGEGGSPGGSNSL